MVCEPRAGVEVTLVDANHCPGAVQFLFQLPDGGPRYVHCGDMRFCAALKDDPHLRRFVGARAVFLDTTYCNPRFTFPLQVIAVVPRQSEHLQRQCCLQMVPRLFCAA